VERELVRKSGGRVFGEERDPVGEMEFFARERILGTAGKKERETKWKRGFPLLL